LHYFREEEEEEEKEDMVMMMLLLLLEAVMELQLNAKKKRMMGRVLDVVNAKMDL
jgi:hypothetical protein